MSTFTVSTPDPAKAKYAAALQRALNNRHPYEVLHMERAASEYARQCMFHGWSPPNYREIHQFCTRAASADKAQRHGPSLPSVSRTPHYRLGLVDWATAMVAMEQEA